MMAKRVPIDTYCEKKIPTLQKTYDGLIDYVDISSVDNTEKKIISYQTIESTDAPSRAKQLLQKGDVLVSTVRPNLNAVAVVEEETENLMVGSTGYCVLRCKDNMDVRYLFNFCQSQYFVDDMSSQATGASYPAVSNGIVRSALIPCCSIEEQREIAEKMDTVSELLALRKQQLAELDELIKSRFIELFGDPIRNTQNRPTTDFINVVKMQRGFDLPVQDRQQDGDIPVFGSNGALDRHNVAKVQGGGVITGRSGTIGKVYYTEGDYWPLNTSLFSVDTHGNNIIYLAYLLQMYDLSRFTEGTGVPTLNRNKFHDKPIIDVPLNEQEQFAVFVKQTDKSKLAVQQSIAELEELKKSLMQQYFG